MLIPISQVRNKILRVYLPNPSLGLHGWGTAFWVDVKGKTKLVTAAHTILRHTHRAQIPASMHLNMEWVMETGNSGATNVTVSFDPNEPNSDYAVIEPLGDIPSVQPFKLGSGNANEYITAIGFPNDVNTNRMGQLDTIARVETERGILVSHHHETGYGSRWLTSVEAQAGYSGCPIFISPDPSTDDEHVEEQVIGMMVGALSGYKHLGLTCSSSFV